MHQQAFAAARHAAARVHKNEEKWNFINNEPGRHEKFTPRARSIYTYIHLHTRRYKQSSLVPRKSSLGLIARSHNISIMFWKYNFPTELSSGQGYRGDTSPDACSRRRGRRRALSHYMALQHMYRSAAGSAAVRACTPILLSFFLHGIHLVATRLLRRCVGASAAHNSTSPELIAGTSFSASSAPRPCVQARRASCGGKQSETRWAPPP